MLRSVGKLEIGSELWGKTNMWVLSRVKMIKPTETMTEDVKRRSIRRFAASLFTSSAYSIEARASTDKGNEKAHHATLNLLIDLLNSVGLKTSDMKRKSERKKSIFEAVSKEPAIDCQAKLAMLGAAKYKNKAGLNIVGRRSVPEKRWYSVTKSTK